MISQLLENKLLKIFFDTICNNIFWSLNIYCRYALKNVNFFLYSSRNIIQPWNLFKISRKNLLLFSPQSITVATLKFHFSKSSLIKCRKSKIFERNRSCYYFFHVKMLFSKRFTWKVFMRSAYLYWKYQRSYLFAQILEKVFHRRNNTQK